VAHGGVTSEFDGELPIMERRKPVPPIIQERGLVVEAEADALLDHLDIEMSDQHRSCGEPDAPMSVRVTLWRTSNVAPIARQGRFTKMTRVRCRPAPRACHAPAVGFDAPVPAEGSLQKAKSWRTSEMGRVSFRRKGPSYRLSADDEIGHPAALPGRLVAAAVCVDGATAPDRTAVHEQAVAVVTTFFERALGVR
jgi:hypothetical protein